MKRICFALLICLFISGVAVAQMGVPTSDVLGAHLNYGRGCPACHAPHSGAWGNGANASGDTSSGNFALWGQDVGNLFNKAYTFGQMDHSGTASSFAETLPGTFDITRPDTANLMTCLSCHDGNYAQGAMMRNKVYETLPATYGTFNTIPTLLGNDGNGKGDFLNDHPVGLNATVGCGGAYNWDCTIGTGTGTGQNGIALGAISPGPLMTTFKANYGLFVQTFPYNGQPTVMCTSCHNQHLMNVVSVNSTNSGLPAGFYTTMFFIRAPYNPGTTTPGSNQNAQFCRQCHGGESNEMNGASIATIF